MTPAELRASLLSVKAGTEHEARSRRFVGDVLDAHPDDPAAAISELERAVQALNQVAWLLRQP